MPDEPNQEVTPPMRGAHALAILLVLLVPAAFPAAALAHASLLGSRPAAGSVVLHAPARIVLRFDDPVRDAGTAVVDSRGSSVLGGRPRVEPGDSHALVVPLRRGIGDGDYTVRWRVVATDDGHITSGVVAIGVGRNRPPPQAAASQTSTVDWPFVSARFAYFLGLMLLVGGAVFRVAVFRPVLATVSGRPRAMAELRESARANALLLGAAVLMLAGGWVALTRQGAEVAGVSFWQAFNHHGPIASALDATRFGREFGRGIDLGAAFCVVTAAAFAIARRSRVAALVLAVPAAGLGTWAVIVPGFSGHAGDPGLGLPAVAVDALHTAAAAVWIGGLVQLVLVTPHATRGLSDGERTRVRTALTARFSRIALGSVAVLAATGVGRSLWAVSSPTQLWGTGYGRALVVKTALLAGVSGLAYANRRRLSAFRVIRTLGAVEIGLLLAVLAVVALLTDLPPANTPGVGTGAPAPAGGPVSLRLAGGARLALWPGLAGRNALDVRLPGATGRTLAVRTAAGRATLRRAPDGSYAGLLPALSQGQARLRIGRLTAAVSIGARPGSPPAAAAPAATGATAAAEAADLAVGGQRVGRRLLRLTLLSQTGAAAAAAIAVVDGHVATPCPGVEGVCYQAPVDPVAERVHVAVTRPGAARVDATLRLPAADARPAPRLLRRAARTFAALRSLRAENVLASGPGRSVSTTFIVQAPDRLAIDIHGGRRSRIIGTTRWDERANGTWKRSYTPAIRQPDPFWAPTAEAVYVAGGGPHTVQLTLVQPGGPTFFRLWVDRRTHLVTRLRMVTAAHFMRERELDPNSAAPVVPPS
jgi:copper transport protein